MKFVAHLVLVTQGCSYFLLLNSHFFRRSRQGRSWERVFWRCAASLRESSRSEVRF